MHTSDKTTCGNGSQKAKKTEGLIAAPEILSSRHYPKRQAIVVCDLHNGLNILHRARTGACQNVFICHMESLLLCCDLPQCGRSLVCVLVQWIRILEIDHIRSRNDVFLSDRCCKLGNGSLKDLFTCARRQGVCCSRTALIHFVMLLLESRLIVELDHVE